jgi:hypothetical protein
MIHYNFDQGQQDFGGDEGCGRAGFPDGFNDSCWAASDRHGVGLCLLSGMNVGSYAKLFCFHYETCMAGKPSHFKKCQIIYLW